MSTGKETQVVYAPRLLNSLTEICEAFHVSAYTVRRWAAQHAPIVMDGEGPKRRYSAELLDLHAWRKRQSGVA